MGYLVLLDTLLTIHQAVMGYLVLLDTLLTIHQAVMGYLVLLDTNDYCMRAFLLSTYNFFYSSSP
jgi:hypothetical protein